jgi:pimeloyl-ACP methyl ester carboxylesterase
LRRTEHEEDPEMALTLDDTVRVTHVTVPVLLVEATASPWRLLPDLVERRACFSRRWCRLIEGAGHMVHHERPAELAALIAGFTAAVRSGQFVPDP